MEQKRQRYLFLDVETTGLDPKKNEVIEVAALIIQEDKDYEPTEVARFSGKWGATDGEIDIEALAVNGRRLSEDVLTDNVLAVRRNLVLNFADFLAAYVTKDTFIVGANVKFDIEFITELFKYYGINAERTLSYRNAVDIQHIARFLHDRGIIELPNFRMVTIANDVLNQKKPDNTHQAMADVILTADTYFAMRELV